MVFMRKWFPFLLVIILALVLFIIQKSRKDPGNNPRPGKDRPSTINRNRGFDRRTGLLKYSNHAICRMECRKISKQEVQEIMQAGKINYKKSDVKNDRCPRYAVEGTTSDEQRVRIVFAQCNDSTVVVTVIDLETDYVCDCPGDDK